MDESECSSDEMLERILQDLHSKPRAMEFKYLMGITDNFSDERLLGEGGFGTVYKGQLQNGKMIAMKKIKQLKNQDVLEKKFNNEVFALLSPWHPNIVRLLGYCFNTSRIAVLHNENFIMAESPKMLLCFEYLTSSLDKYLIKDEPSGLDWRTCYKIIEGVCCGLRYIHEECRLQNNNVSIIHLDLKPANILLDENMVPKISDFGLSRLLYDNRTHTCTTEGTLGYMAPEYVNGGKISTKADIYSLGVIIIEIITGCKADPDIEQIINKWRNRSAEPLSSVDFQQIRSCLEIGKECVKTERNERPTMEKIIMMLSFNSSLDSEKGPLHKKTKRSCDMPPENAQPPSVLHIDVHAVLLPSQKFFVEQARQHIIEDTKGMIGIWGPVGVGKTLLLKALNNSFETGNSLTPSSSKRGDRPFDFIIYMTALEDCSVQGIQSEIIQRLKMPDGGDSLTTQATKISKFLQGKCFLLLLDGLHCNLNLAAVGLPPLGNQGQLKRKVVITTRSRSLCDQMCVNRAIKVPGLEMDEALELFQQSIGNNSLYSEPRIGALAIDLVEQLRAVPSELRRIGSAMCGKGEPGQWQNIVVVTKELMLIKDQEASSLTQGIVITKLSQCLQNLHGRRNDVNHEIELGKRDGKVATNQINNWLASVDTNISVGMVICDAEQNELNWDLSVIAAGMLRRLQECLSGQPSVVTVEALPPSVQEMPCSSTEQQPSRVEIFEEAMEYIKDSSVGVIGIWGLGGVGKTHLLTNINNAFLRDSFDYVIFITASKEGSVETIQGEICNKLKLPKGGDVKSRANNILDFLKTKNFLILLDDVWGRIDLEAVGIPYPPGSGAQQRRKVVLTTRSKTVCGQMDVRKEINVACLTDNEAWQLFQDKVGQVTLSSCPRILALAKELLKELKGLPLALITVGRAMYGKSNPKQWESAIHYMKQSCCGRDDQDLHMENTVFRRLMFSYDSLRNDTLRACLLTCSLWPEDKMIYTADLIRCWIGLGLVVECDIYGSYRKAHSLIGELTDACLLDSCYTGFSHHIYVYKRILFTHQEMPVQVAVKMHDVIRDMAIWISCGCSDNKDKWVVRAGVGANLSTRTIPWSRAECISLMSSEIDELHPVLPFTGPTSLKRLYLGDNMLDERIFGTIQSFTELTYLDLSENIIKEIPEELFALVNLEHLDLSCNLELRTVPKRLRELTKLKFLYLTGTSIERIPLEVISCLTELQVIDLITTCSYHYSFTYEIIQELCTLANLKAVDIVIEGDDGYESLRNAAGIPFRDLIICRLKETNELCLAVDTLTGDIAGRTLNELHVKYCAMEQIILGDELGKPFDALSVLVLQGLPDLTNITMWEGTSSLQALFPRLTHLTVHECGKLQHLSWAPYLPCLEYLGVDDCQAMKQICMDAGQESSKAFACLKYLTLRFNGKLASLCGPDVTFPCLEELTIIYCPMKRLPFTMQSLPHKLTKLVIDRYSSKELEWEDEGVKSFLVRVDKFENVNQNGRINGMQERICL